MSRSPRRSLKTQSGVSEAKEEAKKCPVPWMCCPVLQVSVLRQGGRPGAVGALPVMDPALAVSADVLVRRTRRVLLRWVRRAVLRCAVMCRAVVWCAVMDPSLAVSADVLVRRTRRMLLR